MRLGLVWVVWGALLAGAASASTLEQLSTVELNRGIKAVLEQSARQAVTSLARPGAFSGERRFPLPESIERSRAQLLSMGRARQLDELDRGMRLAAEQALPRLGPALQDSIRELVIYDSRGLVRSGGASLSRYFQSRSDAVLRLRLQAILKPIVERDNLVRPYQALREKALPLSLAPEASPTLEQYLAGRLLEAVYLSMAEHERRLRAVPASAGNEAARKILSVAF